MAAKTVGDNLMEHMESGWQRGGDMSGPSIYCMGKETLKIPRALHAQNRKRLVQLMGRQSEASLALLQGLDNPCRSDSDHEPVFRQDSNFHYLFGVAEPDCMGAVDTRTGAAYLFVPRLPKEYAVFMGEIPSLEDFKKKYEAEEVRYVDEIPAFMAEFKPATIYLYSGVNTDSKTEGVPASFPGIDSYKVDKQILHPAVFEARVVKSEQEKTVLRYANKISSQAHIEVMRQVRPGMMEYEMEAIFLHHCYRIGGMRHNAYTCICGCGPNASVLHYGHAGAPNNRMLTSGQMILNDMGNEYYCYASDITCSFPVGGAFTPMQRAIYEAVLDATLRVIKSLKPGVPWTSMHELAERTIAEHLIKLDLLKGTVDEVVAAGLPADFFPCGLGHLMGIDTHDVGGYPVGGAPRPTRPGLRNIRMNRDLLEGMVLTVEPGIYFIKMLIEEALKDPVKSKHMNEEKLRGMIGFGGVRIEDNLIITKDGCELMSNVPRTIKEIEAVMSGMEFTPDPEYPIPRPATASTN